MRNIYKLNINKSFTVSLEEELSVSTNYLEMQKIRSRAALEWEIIIRDSNMLKDFVPSLSIQTLIENAIKHNALTTACPLRIVVKQDGHKIEVSNNIHKNIRRKFHPKWASQFDETLFFAYGGIHRPGKG